MESRDVRPFVKFLKGRKNLVGAEIGVEGGRNAKIMFEELDIKHLYLIDIFDTYLGMDDHGVLCSTEVGKACYNGTVYNLRDYMDRITLIVDFSEFAVDKIKEELDFVYIDGNHRYEYVKKDINLYYPKIKIGGVIGGHDFKYAEKGVVVAVAEFFFRTGFQYESWDWWAEKK
jgi:hypothetical protein